MKSLLLKILMHPIPLRVIFARKIYRRSATTRSARKRSCLRQTVGLLLPTDRAVAITRRQHDPAPPNQLLWIPCPNPTFGIARPVGDSEMHAEVLFMPPESHARGSFGILSLGSEH
jgi:hypothetical protein